MSFKAEDFRAKLGKLSNSEGSIQTLSHWVQHHKKAATESAAVWATEVLRSRSGAARLNMIYMVNDVLQNSRRKVRGALAGGPRRRLLRCPQAAAGAPAPQPPTPTPSPHPRALRPWQGPQFVNEYGNVLPNVLPAVYAAAEPAMQVWNKRRRGRVCGAPSHSPPLFRRPSSTA